MTTPHDVTARDVLTGVMALAGGAPAAIPAAVDQILAALAAAGFAIVALPEPNRFPGGEVEWEFADPDMFGYVNVNGETLEATVGDERIGDEGGIATLEGTVPTPAAARALAAALLAAADHQENHHDRA